MRRKEINKHCSLCEYQKKDFKAGSYCGITNEIPYFEKGCKTISLSKTFKNKIKEVNTEYYRLLDKKRKVLIRATILPLFGLLILCLNFLVFKFYYKPFNANVYNYKSFLPISPLFILGTILILQGVFPFISYHHNRGIIHKKKSDLDDFCKLYGHEYDIELKENKGFFMYKTSVKSVKLRKAKMNNINFNDF